jgi:hypothetical protein
MRRNIGTSSSSQKRKKRMRSWAANTPMTAVSSRRSQPKYSRGRSSMFQEMSAATRKRPPVSSMSVALRPSMPMKYCVVMLLVSIHLTRSVNCRPPSSVSKRAYMTMAMTRLTSVTAAAMPRGWTSVCNVRDRKGVPSRSASVLRSWRSRKTTAAPMTGRKISSESNSSSS